MKPPESPDSGTTARWSPETETRPEIKALLLLRRPLIPPEAELFRRLYDDIYDAYYDDVWSTLFKWRVRGELLAELTQETFMRLWDTTIAEGPPDVLLAKLRGLAMGLAWNLGKRERRSPVTDRGIPSSGSEKPAASGPQVDRVIDAKVLARTLFHALSPPHQRVVDAVVLRDLTHEEAGRELGLAKSTVTTRLTAAIERLRALAPDLLSPSQQALV